MPDQLPLNLSPPQRAYFTDYLGEVNRLAVVAAQRAATDPGSPGVFLWGPSAVGKTHLLQAACAAAQASIYLPLGVLASAGAEVLEAVERVGLVCLDDLDRVLGRAPWEAALFHLYNRGLLERATIVVAATCPPGRCEVRLPDLQSRLAAMEVYALQPPAEQDLGRIFQACARRRGMSIGDDVVSYLLRRHRRDLGWLLQVLDRLEEETMNAQRPVTIPVAKAAVAAATESSR